MGDEKRGREIEEVIKHWDQSLGTPRSPVRDEHGAPPGDKNPLAAEGVKCSELQILEVGKAEGGAEIFAQVKAGRGAWSVRNCIERCVGQLFQRFRVPSYPESRGYVSQSKCPNFFDTKPELPANVLFGWRQNPSR